MALMYNKTNWKDDDESTPINARNLNNLEDGIEYIYEKWDDIISDATTGDHAAELIDARNAPGQNNKTLGQRLNNFDSQIKDKVNKKDLANGRVFKGSKGKYSELLSLQDMNTGDYWFVEEDEKFYQYNGIEWFDIGTGDKTLNSLKEEVSTLNENISEKILINRPAVERGSIDTLTGELTDTAIRIRSIDFYNYEKNMYIELENPTLYKYSFRLYDGEGNYISSYSPVWFTSNLDLNEYFSTYNFSKFKLVYAKNDNSAINFDEQATVANSVKLYKFIQLDIKNEFNKVYEEMITNKKDHFQGIVFGGIDTSTGENISGGTIRTRTDDFYNIVTESISISIPEGYEFSLRYYDEQQAFLKSDSIFRAGTYVYTKEDDVFYIRLVIKKSNEAEITNSEIDFLQNNLYATRQISIKSVLDTMLNKEEDNIQLEISSIVNPHGSIVRKNPHFLTLCAVKEHIIQGEQTKTVGWLYRDNVEPYQFYYASGNADNIQPIFKWKKEVTHDKNSVPMNYCFSITAEGDVVCVYRGEDILTETGNRQNPIVYPHTNYEEPVLIDFELDSPPTSWLQNSGCCAFNSTFYFVEYTRVYHDYAYIWKVSYPYTNKENWVKIKQEAVSGDWNVGFKHFHMVDIDPYSNLLYVSSGDDDSASKIIYSNDDGISWIVLATGEKYCRQLNFIWCEDYVYWATDSGKDDKHFFFRAKRKLTGEIDMDTVEDLFKFPNSDTQPATYHVCYIEEPNGILILDRCDVKNTGGLNIYFWDIKNSEMKIVGRVGAVGNGFVGFRCEAVNHYQSFTDHRIVCGFSYFPNQIKIFDNELTTSINEITGAITDDNLNEFKVNNITLRLTQ